MNNQYVTPAIYKKFSAGFMIAGLLTLILGVIFLNPAAGSHGDNLNSTRFWAVLLQNGLFWMFLCKYSYFFYCYLYSGNGGLANSLSQGYGSHFISGAINGNSYISDYI